MIVLKEFYFSLLDVVIKSYLSLLLSLRTYRNAWRVSLSYSYVSRLSGSCRRHVEGAHRHSEEAAKEEVMGFIWGPGKDMLSDRAELSGVD